MNISEQIIESEIQGKGLNAPRLSPDKIDSVIVGEDYYVFQGTTLTVCCLKLRNGFTVTGESASVSLENFDAELGRKIARANAREKIWALEGYALRQKLHDGAIAPLGDVEARYRDLLCHLGVVGHDGAVEEIAKLREKCGL